MTTENVKDDPIVMAIDPAFRHTGWLIFGFNDNKCSFHEFSPDYLWVFGRGHSSMGRNWRQNRGATGMAKVAGRGSLPR